MGEILAARQPMQDTLSIGIDFGTTNTVVAIARPGEPVRAVQFNDNR